MEVIKDREYVIGADQAGVELKNTIKKILDDYTIEYEDIGVNDKSDDTIYPKIAKKVVEKIIESDYKKEGILICGTGIGMAITANKFEGIYAAVCHDIYSAERARLSNDTNVLTMGGRIMGPVLAEKILKKWLSLEFQPGRSTSKLKEIYNYEKKNFN